MEMKRLKKFATSAILIGIMCGLAACSNNDTEDRRKSKVTTETTTESIITSEEVTTEEVTTEEETTEEVTTEEDTTKEDTDGNTSGTDKKNTPKTDFAFSSDDWKTLEFALDGKTYTFPMTLADVEAAGFMIDEEYKSEKLESNMYTTSVTAENEAGEQFYVRFKNFTDADKELKDCEIYGFSFEVVDYRDVNPDVTLCNGVTFGMTIDEVKTLMGEPDYYYESDSTDIDRKEMDYYVTGKSYDSSLELSFTDGKLDSITLVNTD